MVLLEKPGMLQEIKKLDNGVLLYGKDLDTGYVYNSFFEYDVISEDSGTGEIIGFGNL